MAVRRNPDSTDPPTGDGHVPGKRRPGRPPIHVEEWTKVTVVLFNRQIVFLDAMAAEIRTRNGTAVSRAQLIRAFVDAIGETGIDVTAAKSEADIRSIVVTRLSS